MRIVIIHNSDMVTKIISLILTDMDHDVVLTRTREEALREVTSKEVNAILIGTELPGLDSFQFCKEVRAVRYKGPVIFLSRYGDLEYKLKAFGNGADDYPTEPFEPEELLARIEAAARRCNLMDQQPLGNVVKVGDAELSTGEMTFRSKDQPPVSLTPTEMRLLERLMRNAGITISRETLIIRTWGYDHFGDSNRVDVYIARLRKKIEVDPAQPRYLHTIRGAGYVFRINDFDPLIHESSSAAAELNDLSTPATDSTAAS